MLPNVALPQASHASVQFLNTVLSQRGPNALPYEEDMKMFIRQHLITLIQEFPSLQAKPAMFTHNDGNVVNLLQADGTIPMYYQDVMYNIPVTIWLLESYPRSPPRVFVTPTRDMIIKRPHRNVDASGLVGVPYLQNWVFPRSNLVELVRSLSLIFGQDPPLYSKASTPPIRSPPPPPPPNSYQGMNPMHGGGVLVNRPPAPSPLGLSSSASQSHTTPPRFYTPYAQLPPSPQRANGTESPSEVFKRNAINALVGRLQRDKAEMKKALEMEMEKLMNTQGLLRQREEQLKKGVQEMQQEKEGLEQQLQVILTNTDVLETWLKNNDKGTLEVDIDDAFEHSDVLSKQMLECTSQDLAIEDALYSLDKAVQEGAIPVDAYLKHVRSLSREQFFHRATSVKVRATQMQSQIASMAARAVPYVS
eukprot:c24368_g1_i1 orf=342-1601(+)